MSDSSDSSSSEEEVKPVARVRKAPPEPVKKLSKVKKLMEEIRNAPDEDPPKKTYQRLATDKRLAVIALKERGIEDPEYRATKSAAGRWTVKKRKVPIDQSPDLDRTAGHPTLPPVKAPAPEPAPEPEVHKKDSLDLNWINMQATVNDSLKRDLETLSEKYEKLAQKEEKRKRLKAKMTPPPPQSRPMTPQNPPPTQAPVPPAHRGLYRRASKLSITQF
jgi:hypothetical protein